MKGKLQEPEQNIQDQRGANYPFAFCFLDMPCPSCVKLGTCTSSRELWNLQLIDGIFYRLPQVSVFQSQSERIRSLTPMYPFTLGIVFRLALRLCINSQMHNINILSALILSYQDLQLKIHGDPKTLHCCKQQVNGKSLADTTPSLLIT